jgi:hypothetical protein
MSSNQDNGKTERFDAETGEIEAIEIVAEHEAEIEATGLAGVPVEEEPVKIIQLITPKLFLAGALAPDLIAGRPLGQSVVLGSLFGEIAGVERLTNEWQGKKLVSVLMHGVFEARIFNTDERIAAPGCIMPNSVGFTMETAFSRGAKAALIDVTVGLERVQHGAITYAWAVWSHMGTELRAKLNELRKRQEARRMKAPPSPRLTAN